MPMVGEEALGRRGEPADVGRGMGGDEAGRVGVVEMRLPAGGRSNGDASAVAGERDRAGIALHRELGREAGGGDPASLVRRGTGLQASQPASTYPASERAPCQDGIRATWSS